MLQTCQQHATSTQILLRCRRTVTCRAHGASAVTWGERLGELVCVVIAFGTFLKQRMTLAMEKKSCGEDRTLTSTRHEICPGHATYVVCVTGNWPPHARRAFRALYEMWMSHKGQNLSLRAAPKSYLMHVVLKEILVRQGTPSIEPLWSRIAERVQANSLGWGFESPACFTI